MVNCNPETVSTDYDTSDRLYFEPLTYRGRHERHRGRAALGEQGGGRSGVIVVLGGQTPLKLADVLPRELILGTSPDSIDLAEDRDRWNALCARLEIPQPAGGTATDLDEALDDHRADRLSRRSCGRSYVLGGRAMEIVYDDEGLRAAHGDARRPRSASAAKAGCRPTRPVLVDRFLEDATEVDVDAIRDAHRRGASSAGSWSTSRRPGCTRATPPA